jgi:hypothetical protein
MACMKQPFTGTLHEPVWHPPSSPSGEQVRRSDSFESVENVPVQNEEVDRRSLTQVSALVGHRDTYTPIELLGG